MLCLRMIEVTGSELDALRRQLIKMARQFRGARTLTESIYGVGPITALASRRLSWPTARASVSCRSLRGLPSFAPDWCSQLALSAT
jgi:transposase